MRSRANTCRELLWSGRVSVRGVCGLPAGGRARHENIRRGRLAGAGPAGSTWAWAAAPPRAPSRLTVANRGHRRRRRQSVRPAWHKSGPAIPAKAPGFLLAPSFLIATGNSSSTHWRRDTGRQGENVLIFVIETHPGPTRSRIIRRRRKRMRQARMRADGKRRATALNAAASWSQGARPRRRRAPAAVAAPGSPAGPPS
jgi:hypothetical protein